jgi:hypothetical protein
MDHTQSLFVAYLDDVVFFFFKIPQIIVIGSFYGHRELKIEKNFKKLF